MKETIIVNLIGSPGTGKSTLMADVFAGLKWSGIDCEMVSEFAKKLVWSERKKTFTDELYIFAKQNHELFMVNGQVDVIVTDRPLILTVPYLRKYGDKKLKSYNDSLEKMVYNRFILYNNLNILLNRTKPYNPNGRNQTEDESKKLQIDFKNCLDEFNIEYTELDADVNAKYKIIEMIQHLINDKKNNTLL